MISYELFIYSYYGYRAILSHEYLIKRIALN